MFTGGHMPERITKILPPRNPSLDRQDKIIQRLQTAPGVPLINVPPGVADTISAVAALEFGGRCTFVQLLHACLSLPEFAWWASPTNTAKTPAEQCVQDMIDAETPADDRPLYGSVHPVTSDPAEIPLMITEAIRENPDWDIVIVPPTKYSSQRLVFQKRTRHGP
jgi:hypothetical protein